MCTSFGSWFIEKRIWSTSISILLNMNFSFRLIFMFDKDVFVDFIGAYRIFCYSKTSHWTFLDSECERIFLVPSACNNLVNVKTNGGYYTEKKGAVRNLKRVPRIVTNSKPFLGFVPDHFFKAEKKGFVGEVSYKTVFYSREKGFRIIRSNAL